MTSTYRLAAVLTTLLSVAPAAHAQMYDIALSQLTTKFKAADKDGNGKLSLQEAKDGDMARVVANFKTVDTDKDGYVTFAQLKAQLDARYK